MTTLSIGDIVHITHETSPRYCGTWTVTKVNPTTYALTAPDRGGLKAPHDVVQPGPMPAGMPTNPTPYNAPLGCGTVVTARGLQGAGPRDLFVVTGVTPKGHRLFRLGGSVKYFTGIPGNYLTTVDVSGWRAP